MKTNKRVDRLMFDLLGRIEFSYVAGDRDGLLRLVQQWLRAHLLSWTAQERERWGLERLATMPIPELPTEESSLYPDEEVQVLKRRGPISMDTLGMFTRELIWNGVTVESTLECPQCTEAQLLILLDKTADAVVLSCNFCGCAQTSSGSRWDGTSPLQAIPRTRLARWRTTGR